MQAVYFHREQNKFSEWNLNPKFQYSNARNGAVISISILAVVISLAALQ
jgi:hypothetical protein